MTQKKSANHYHGVTEKLIDLSESTLGKFDDTVDNIQRQAKQYSQRMEKYVLANPSESVGIAFAAGFAFAILMRGWLK